MDTKRETKKIQLRQRTLLTNSPKAQSDEEGTSTTDHQKYLKKISESDRIINKLKLENTKLREKIKSSKDNHEEDYNKLCNENKLLKELLKQKEQEYFSLETRFITRNNLNDITETVGSLDTDNMEILTPLKQKIEKREKENISLAMRIDELETENKTLCDLIKTNDSTTSTPQINIQSNLDKIRELEQKTNIFRKKIKLLTSRLNSIAKKYASLNRNYAILKNKEISRTAIHKSIETLKESTNMLKNIIKEATNSNIKVPYNAVNLQCPAVDTPPSNSLGSEHAMTSERSADSTENDPRYNSYGIINDQTQTKQKEKEIKPNLLLLSDCHGIEITAILSRLRKDFNFTGDIIKHGTADRVLLNVTQKAAQFTARDCVVIMCGGSDYNVHTPVETVQLVENAVKDLTHCNIVVCAIPLSVNFNDKGFNLFANKVNAGLILTMSKYKNVKMQSIDDNLTIEDYAQNGYNLRIKGKFKVATAISGALKEINERFYNSLNFLETTATGNLTK